MSDVIQEHAASHALALDCGYKSIMQHQHALDPDCEYKSMQA